jgi:hypothetical protein
MWPYIWWFSCQKNRMHTVYMIYMVLANPTHITSEHLVQRQRAFFWFVGNLLRSLPTQPCKIRPICCAVYVLVRNLHNHVRSDQSVVHCMFLVQNQHVRVRATNLLCSVCSCAEPTRPRKSDQSVVQCMFLCGTHTTVEDLTNLLCGVCLLFRAYMAV